MSKHVKSKDLDVPKAFNVGVQYFLPVFNSLTLDDVRTILINAIDSIEEYYSKKFPEFNTTLMLTKNVCIKLAIRERTIEILHGKIISTKPELVIDNKSFKLMYKGIGVSYKSCRKAVEELIDILSKELETISIRASNTYVKIGER